ncbi:hypothetical protein [Gracilimonas halophila]|uniref:Transcriptional regulator, AlpA family n=1 Tax=Gracilimonas halophila TaxID=1834464 RepID=A0ABW5JLM7_9BACT
MKKEIHTFTLLLDNENELTNELEDALFQAGCDDGILYSKNQVVYIEFDREAESLEEAVISAINDVESAGFQVARVEPSDLVTSAEISRRAQRSRQSVAQIIKGKRGKGGFPIPVAGVTGKTSVWSWAEVSNWLLKKEKIDDPFLVKKAEVIRDINDTLELRKNPFLAKKVNFFIHKIEQKPDAINSLLSESKRKKYYKNK